MADEQQSTPNGDSKDRDKRKNSIKLPAPEPTSWATNADLSQIRANTPLAVPPPPPQQPLHDIKPVTKTARSKSNASEKAGGVLKRMFGGSLTPSNPDTKQLQKQTADPPLTPLANLTIEPPTPMASDHSGQHPPLTPGGSSTLAPSSVAEWAASTAQPPDSNRPTTNGYKSPSRPSSRAPSTDGRERPGDANSQGQGQRFTLKDLMGGSNDKIKLQRKSSASSRRSVSSAGGGDREHGYGSAGEAPRTRSSRAPSSAGGESTTTSLLAKYGVCERAAIGKGATSVVRLAHNWNGSEEKLYAIKEFRKRRKNETEKEYVKKLTSEFCISSALRHPNIVETVDLVQDENQHWCEVMEYCPGGDLYAAIKRGRMSPSEVECSFKQILLGVEYLHSQGVAHRDIKPENLFFNAKGQLKIGDYGASTVYRLPWQSAIHMSTGLCGSEPYIAPEEFTKQPYDARLVDIWACGVVYYCLHFQELPWRVATMSDPLYAAYAQATQSKNKAESECPETINNLSPKACRPLLRKMLEPDVKKRILIEDVMKDEWIKGIEVCTEMDKPSHVHVHARQVTSGMA